MPLAPWALARWAAIRSLHRRTLTGAYARCPPHVERRVEAACRPLARMQSLGARRADHNLWYGYILCVFQIYRTVLLPFANTWMLWSLLLRMDVRVSAPALAAQLAAALACLLLSVRLRALLHVPVQFLTVCCAASAAARLCAPPQPRAAMAACVGGVLSVQLAVSVAVPLLLTVTLDYSGAARRSSVPHVQAKRALFDLIQY